MIAVETLMKTSGVPFLIMCSPASNALNKVKVPEWPEVPHTPAIIGSRLKNTLAMIITYPAWKTYKPAGLWLKGGYCRVARVHKIKKLFS